MSSTALNMKSIFAKIPKSFWRDLAVTIRRLIIEDMQAGTVQKYTEQKRQTSGGSMHYSKQYKEAKANNFKRKTVGKAKESTYTFNAAGDIVTKNLYFRNRKAKYTQKNPTGTGKRLKSYSGISIASNQTQQVNMMVTGKTGKGLHLDEILPNGVVMSYKSEDAKKILGNEDMGRIITTLSEKNQKIIFKMFSDMLDKIVKDWAKQDIVLTVGK